MRPYLDTIYDYFGPHRLLIGSEWPVCTLAADCSRTLGLVREHLVRRPPAEQEAILGGNAERFWNLRP